MQKKCTPFLATCLLAAAPLSVMAQVMVSKTENEVTIGNAYMSRRFSIAGDRLQPGQLINKRTPTPTIFTPSAGSEEFALNPVTIVAAVGELDRSTWQITADGYSDDAGSGQPKHAIDASTTTWWHSHYGNSGNTAMPHYLMVTLPESKLIKSFAYAPRPGSATANGQVKGYRLWVGATESTLTKVSEGDLPFTGELQWINVATPMSGKVIKFEILSSHNGLQYAAVGDFRLSTEAQVEAASMLQPLDRSQWKVSADSWCVESAMVGDPKHIVDGNATTLWHTWYTGQTQGTLGRNTLPFSFMIDLGSAQTFRSIGYEPRPLGDNGKAKEYEFFVSDDSLTWRSVKRGLLNYDNGKIQWIDLAAEHTARYVKFTIHSTTNGAAFGSCAEFYLARNAYVEPKSHFVASQLTLREVREEALTDGKRLVFDMAPYQHTNARNGQQSLWDIDMVVEMKHNDHFLRKYLRIKGADEAARNTPIDYIEMESLGMANVPAGHSWTHPAGSGGVGGMSAYTLTLGQPVYVEGLFMGSEFPQAENEIANNAAHTRYYSGKSLATLAAIGRVDSEGYFRTWSNVVGASRSATDLNVIRSDFFKYITSIAKPIGVRLQYNSWYDWMMRIDEEKINNSFREMELGFSQHGIRPMDSYVVDDGWNNYQVNDVQRSGVGNNQTGFWEFNSKFPNGLQGASQIARRYGSDFGIWLGPRGGYNFNGSWGQLLERHGNGTYNRNSYDAVTGDSVYIAKLKAFFLENQAKYGVNYWKLDGFSTIQPQPSTNGRYITGGKEGNYYFTEHWERWYDTFDALYREADTRQSKLWLNLTCYVNPSPWILQWSNSVWIQNSTDKGDLTVGGRTRQMDKFLSYRDDRYFDFINNNQLQFPLANIFNHDPIYGQEEGVAANSMTDAEFRAYLYMMATRGTAFWEMLYSYNFMNEGNKWMINGEAINFIEKNYATLRNAKYFGQSPRAGQIYGYSCWKEADDATQNEGIVSFRNPSGTRQSYTFRLDNTVGVPEHAAGLSRSLVMSYSGNQGEMPLQVKLDAPSSTTYAYGETFTVTLEPGEIRIWKFTPVADVQPAQLHTLAAIDKRKIVVTFDEPVAKPLYNHFEVYEGDTKVSRSVVPQLGANYRTVNLSVVPALEEGKRYTLRVNGLKDWNGNVTQQRSSEFYLHQDSVVLIAKHSSDLKLADDISMVGELREGQLMQLNKAYTINSTQSFVGKGSFSVTLQVRTTMANATLLKQGDSYRVGLEGGKPVFSVGGLTYVADSLIADGKTHLLTCTRENNGMLKIYIDGQLQGTKYDAAHINSDITEAPIELGSDGAALQLGEVSVRLGAYNYKQVSAIEAERKQEHFLINVTAPTTAAINFVAAKDSVTTERGVRVARVAAGKTVTLNIAADPQHYIAAYAKDNVRTELADKQSSLSLVFANVTADHDVTIEVQDLVASIADATQHVRVSVDGNTISVSGTAGHTQLKAYTIDGHLLGQAKGSGQAVIKQVQWAGACIIEIHTAAGKQVLKLMK